MSVDKLDNNFWNELTNLDPQPLEDEKKSKKTCTKKDLENLCAKFGDRFLENVKHDVPCFDKFQIDSNEVLKQITERYICDKCYRSRRYFCYNCFTISPCLENRLPCVRLPVKIDIIKHAREVDGKSTSPHAAILAPQDVRLFIYPKMPDDWPNDTNRILLIFPRKNSPTISQYLREVFKIAGAGEPTPPPLDQLPFDRIVFIDSTWNQTKGIMKDLRLQKLPSVVIDAEETMFWRSNKRRPSYYLSTIEAIYYFCVQLHRFMTEFALKTPVNASRCTQQLATQFPPYSNQYDNLLFFFKHSYNLIRDRYQL